jgi:hypothetical protein
MNLPKYYICPMSKNIVDAVLELNDNRFGLLPTRRQIDWDGGYVNGWNTKTFYEYVKEINPNIILQRDHSGPNQGKEPDYGYETHTHDAKYFDIIHLDPWKYFNNHLDGVKETVTAIKYIHHINPNVKFEILTEEAIKPFTDSELIDIMQYLVNNLTKEEFDSIIYIVLQSGVGLDLVNMKNTGTFNLQKLKNQSLLFKSFGKKTKEHNGDYLNIDEIKIRFQNGLDSLNIGPEIAQIETLTYLDNMTSEQIDKYYQICLDSKKWERWIGKDFDFGNKRKLIQVCGHYCFGQYDLPKIDDIVKKNIKNKLNHLP